ncbi:putative mucin TcMUCII [Trypanosoma cruzi]|nr:putative mucin TcMUCII [Trypanosoma cruzi]
MMTCRLLCALLVLALCCCPSVCATGSEDTDKVTTDANIPAVPPGLPLEEVGHPGLLSERSDTEDGIAGGEGPDSTASGPKLSNGIDKVHGKGTDSTPGPESSTRPLSSVPLANPADASAETTTTNTTITKTPTTTTTTTTTKAPTMTTTTTHAPSTTTTEAPTTTTTHAPSRLREIDGSLSSSAWVCAPLVLAASALAYTTLG